MGLPLSFDGARPGIRRPPPSLGQHTAEIMGESAAPTTATSPALATGPAATKGHRP